MHKILLSEGIQFKGGHNFFFLILALKGTPYTLCCLRHFGPTSIIYYRPKSEGDNVLGSVRPSVNALMPEPFYL